jgi:hypothetical protein
LTRVPARLSGYGHLEEAIETKLTSLKKGLTEEERRTVVDEALARIGRGLGLQVAEFLERSVQPMPPLPGTEKFALEIARILRLPSQLVESWRGSIVWRHMAIPIFLGLLTEHGNEKSIGDIEASIEFKGRWFRELLDTGVTDDQLEWSLGRPNYRRYPNLKARMHAELRRFSRTDYGDSSSKRARVELLSSNIMRLHEIDASLPIDRFVSLLTPYLDDMSADGIMLALDDHLQFDKGRTWGSFLWHLPPSDFVASRLADMVEESGFTWLCDFANYNCRVSLEEFKGRVAEMEAANIYTARLEMNVRRTFLAERPPDEREGGGGDVCAVTCEPVIPDAMGLGMSTMAMSAMLAARAGMVV